MDSRQSATAGTITGVVLMLFVTAAVTGPAAHAADPKIDTEAIKARVLAALHQDPDAHDEITAPEQPAEPTKPAATQPASQESSDAAPAGDEIYIPPDIQVSAEGRVELHVRNLDLGSVLQMLSMQARRNIVASKKVSGTVSANLYNVTFNEALTAILDSNNAKWREQGNFIYVYTNEELAALDAAQSPPITRVFRLHYIRAANAHPLVTPLLSKEGKVTMPPPAAIGLAPSKEQAGGDTLTQEDCLVVTDYPSRIEQIARLIADIDARPKQVLIEATILRALLNEDNALGIDFNLVHGVDFSALGSASGGTTSTGTTAAATPNRLSLLGAASNGGTDANLGQLPGNALNNSVVSMNTDFRTQVASGGFSFGFIHHDIGMFIRALEQVTDTTVLANPKILTLNKQRGEVIVGRRDGYLTTTVTQTASIQTVEFLETGTRLLFRPFIGDDGYIRMEVHPEDSTGGVTAANLPYEQTTEVTTNIMVRDGRTILIGGLFRESTTANREQLPVIGNIPIAGALFRNTHDTTQREEIIILLTVHVIKDDQAMQEASTDAIDNVERLRVGMRQGLQCFGRERLAQAHYRWALEHLEKNHLGRALWDLDLAINNNPKFLAAIRLKEDLLGRRDWDEDNSLLRTFLTREIQREQGDTETPFGRPGPSVILPDLHGPKGFDEPSGTTGYNPTPQDRKKLPATAPANGDLQ